MDDKDQEVDVTASGIDPDDGCSGKKKKPKDSLNIAQRYDVYEDWDLFKFKKTPEGYLTGCAVVTNIGVFTYQDYDGTTIRELRHPDDVFAQDSLATYKNKPITNEHPNEEVNVSNVGKYQVGFAGSEVMTDAYHVMLPITFMDAQTITDIENGKRGLSCGYSCELEDAPEGAMYLGVPYDKRQRNIRMNHIAVVDRGRAGDAARMRLDSQAPIVVSMHRRDDHMDVKLRTVNLDGVDFQAEDKVIEALQSAQAKATAVEAKVDALGAEKTRIEAERDALKEKHDALELKNKELLASRLDEAEIEKRVNSRIALRLVAEKAGVAVTDGMDETAIKSAIITAKYPKVKLDGMTPEYIQARYEIVVEDMADTQEQNADSEVRGLKGANLDGIPSAKEKRLAMIDRIKSGKK